MDIDKWLTDRDRTHWEGCEEHHLRCAVAKELDRLRDELRHAEAEIDRLRASVAELKRDRRDLSLWVSELARDRERLDWLERAEREGREEGELIFRWSIDSTATDDIRAAIDAAMRAEREGE